MWGPQICGDLWREIQLGGAARVDHRSVRAAPWDPPRALRILGRSPLPALFLVAQYGYFVVHPGDCFGLCPISHYPSVILTTCAFG
jgi:hypothetical protein